jgi:hypothetical protein
MDNFNTGTYYYQVLAYSELIIPHEVVQYLQLLIWWCGGGGLEIA